MEMREAFYRVFTDDPVNWVKWAVVFAILIGGYVIAIPLYGKVSYRLSWARKRDIARERGHVIRATLMKKHCSGDLAHYDWNAVYRYTAENGEEKKYRAFFKHPTTPPRILNLYYVDSPKRLFSYEEYHYENHKGIILLPLILLPWILALAAMWILQIPLQG